MAIHVDDTLSSHHRPSLLLSLLDRDTMRFALSMASIIGGFKGVNCVMRKYRGKEDRLNSFVAGCVAGYACDRTGSGNFQPYIDTMNVLSYSLALGLDDRQRRIAIAVYISTRGLQMVGCWLRACLCPRF